MTMVANVGSGAGVGRPPYPYEDAAQAWTAARERRDRAEAAFQEADREQAAARVAENEAWRNLEAHAGRDMAPVQAPMVSDKQPGLAPYRARGFVDWRYLLGCVLVAALVFGVTFMARADDPTTGTVDGAGVADKVANEASPYRLSVPLSFLPGRPLLVPAVAVTPLALDLKDKTLEKALNVGGGFEVLWNAVENPVGFALHGLLRATDAGPEGVIAGMAVLPYLSQASVRIGVGYQLGGHAMLLASAATNLGR